MSNLGENTQLDNGHCAFICISMCVISLRMLAKVQLRPGLSLLSSSWRRRYVQKLWSSDSVDTPLHLLFLHQARSHISIRNLSPVFQTWDFFFRTNPILDTIVLMRNWWICLPTMLFFRLMDPSSGYRLTMLCNACCGSRKSLKAYTWK